MIQFAKLCKGLLALPLLLSLTACFDVTPMSTIHTLTKWGHDINSVYLITTVICFVIAFLVAIPFCYALYRFRERPGDTHMPKQIHGNVKLEIAWTLIPVVLLIFIFIPTAKVIFSQSNYEVENPFKVKVIGHQWWWEFQYPELGITTANELHLPESRNIVFELTSDDVIHSFWIPRFGGKVDTLPGHINHMAFNTPKAEKVGGDYYQGQCVELCGLSHALMRFQAVVHKQDEFDRWVKVYNEKPQVASDLERAGEKLFTTKTCFTCHTIAGTTAQGKVGPNLSNLGNRQLVAAGILPNNKESLHKWLKDPGAIKEGALMPNLNLTDDEIAALSSYLLHSTAKTY